MDLIYCAKGNRQLAPVAISEGWLYGSQPGTVYHPVSFCDLDFKRITETKYLRKYAEFVRGHKPKYATAPDIFAAMDVSCILRYAETELAPHTQNIIIIPKACGVLERLPKTLGNARIIAGFSVPSRYGASSVPEWEFAASCLPIHLLGGSPKRQLILAQYLNVISADGNMMNKMSTRNCASWKLTDWNFSQSPGEGIAESFRRSCREIKQAWQQA